MSKDDLGSWMCAESVDTEYWKASERFHTKEDASIAGRSALQDLKKNWENKKFIGAHEIVIGCTYDDYEEPPKRFAVGQIHTDWTPTIDTDVLLEWINENAYDNCGEFAEVYLDNLPREQVDELDEQLNKVFNAWLDKHDNHPGFFTIYLVDEVEVS